MTLLHAETYVANKAITAELLHRVAREIREDPSWSFSIDQLMAGASYRNKTHFNNVFRSMFGLPPMRYVIHQRMILAKQLIREGWELDDVCIATGYSMGSRSRFTQLFTKVVGIPPSMYRLRLMEGMRIIPGTEGPVEPCGGLARHSDLQM